jgi:hypothetical protein
VLRTATEVHVRDSKNPDGRILTFDYGEWSAFLSGVKGGEFERPEDAIG